MTIFAGEIVTAARLMRLQPVTYLATASSDLNAGNTDTDVPGATITFNTATANAVYTCDAVFDMDGVTSGSTSVCIGFLNIDGSNQTAQALSQVGSASSNSRGTVAQQWNGTLAASGSHTFKLKGTTPSGGVRIGAVHTTIKVTIYEVV